MKLDPEKSTVAEICTELLEARKAQGISQQRLSEMANISRTGLRHIESLNTSPTLFSLLKISKALGLSLSDLIDKHQQ